MAKDGQNNPTDEQVQAFAGMDWDGPVNMLNLLKFRAQADYGGRDEPVRTGQEAYATYIQHASKCVQGVGGKQLYAGLPQAVLIGDEAEDWDMVLIVQYPSPAALLQMINDPAYQAIAYHRGAALQRSALVAMKPAG